MCLRSAGDGGGEKKEELHLCPPLGLNLEAPREEEEMKRDPRKCEGEPYKSGGGGVRRGGGFTYYTCDITHSLPLFSLSLPKAKEHLQGCPLPHTLVQPMLVRTVHGSCQIFFGPGRLI